MKALTRREILGMSLAASAGTGLGAGSILNAGQGEQDDAPQAQWVYQKIDPVRSAALAYDYYPKWSCMYAVFAGVLKQLGERFGHPYDTFPVEMMAYGHGGTAGFGTLCGALNGAAAVIGLFHHDKKERDGMIQALFTWYEMTELPRYQPASAEPVFAIEPNSVLCHTSLSRWCEHAGIGPNEPPRKERCRRLSADVAGQTVQLLNAWADQAASPTSKAYLYQTSIVDRATDECLACHSQHGYQEHSVKTSMHCGTCHNQSLDHPEKPENGPHHP